MKILIIRSAPVYILKKVAKKIMEDFKEAEIFVLTGIGSFNEVKKIDYVREVIAYQGVRFGVLRLDLKLWLRLLKERFDKVVVLYSNYFGEGYLNIELIPLFIFTRSLLGFNKDGKCIISGYWDLTKKSLSHFLCISKCFLVWFLILLLMPFFYGFRRLKRDLFDR